VTSFAVVAAAIAVAVPGVQAPAAKPDRAHTGGSSIDTKVGFRLGGGQVKGFAIGYVAPCDDGETLRGTYRFKPTRVRRGRFGVRGSSTGTLPDGRATGSKLRLAGVLARGRSRGTFAITTQMARPEGEGVATCRSGRLSWTASR